jgi:hypothetical protein
MRLLFFCLFAFSTWSTASTNDAFVTFYTDGSLVTYGVPGSKHGYFAGVVFDGQQSLGYLRRHRFMTLRFPAGEHVFSGSYSGKHPAENSQLSLKLEEGKSYFIRAESESRGIYIVDSEKGRLEVVTCEAAHADLQKSTAVEEKHVPKDIRDRLVQDKSLPECHEAIQSKN